MRYENSTSWNMVNLCLLSFIRGKYVRVSEDLAAFLDAPGHHPYSCSRPEGHRTVSSRSNRGCKDCLPLVADLYTGMGFIAGITAIRCHGCRADSNPVIVCKRRQKSMEPSLCGRCFQEQQVARILRFFTLANHRSMSPALLSGVAPAAFHLSRLDWKVTVKFPHCFLKCKFSPTNTL
ncbi:hypothetical protein GOODEAATRI_003400 [Goodea atripinnis]|uniref:Uncharacterized protein n=1 Tax=Goodea atripinnis TaxID=208336 RepID=A0ABV0NH68_9TELE